MSAYDSTIGIETECLVGEDEDWVHVAPQSLAVPHGNGQEKLLLLRSHWSREPTVKRGQMDEGMVPVSSLPARDLHQCVFNTIQRQEGSDLSSSTAHTAAGEEEGPHLQALQAREVPQAVGDGAVKLVVGEGPAAVGGQHHTGVRECRAKTTCGVRGLHLTYSCVTLPLLSHVTPNQPQ